MASSKPTGDSPRWRNWIIGCLVALVLLAPIPKMLTTAATSMEEGSLLEYPTLALHGEIPTKAYWTEYGPLNVWVPAGAYELTGPSVLVERLVGLAYRAVLLFSLFSLLKRYSRPGAVGGVLISWLILAPFGAIAYSWIAGLAFGLAGLAVLTAALDDAEPRRARVVAGGLLLGIALSFRPDMILGVGLGAVLLLRRRKHQKIQSLVGIAIGVLPLGALVLLAGFHDAITNLVIDPIFNLRAGRHLPVPPPTRAVGEYFTRIEAWTTAATRWPGQAPAVQLASFFWVVVIAGVILVASMVVIRRRAEAKTWIPFMGFALFLAPQLVQRCDLNHMRFVGVVWLAALPTAVLLLAGTRAAKPGRLAVEASVGVGLALFLAAPFFQVQAFAEMFPGLGRPVSIPGSVVHHAGRSIPTGSAHESRAINRLLGILDRIPPSRYPGGIRFIEGPADLRLTNYSETWMYWLEPTMIPATYYLEMNPGISNATNSRLAGELGHADLLVLSDRYNAFSEPNASVIPGNPAPNRVVEQHYCELASTDWYHVLIHRPELLRPADLPPSERVVVGGHPEARCSALTTSGSSANTALQ